MAVLEIDELDAGYGEFQALFGINFRVEQGEKVAIIGSNGAGKTTLLRAITGEVNIRRGGVAYKGQNIKGSATHNLIKQGVAMVPEGRKIFPSLSVSENLQIGAYGRRKGHWDIAKIYSLFPILKERANFPGIDLSGGQQQMLAIGRALMSNPDLLLMDEISLGLAPIIVKELYHVIPEITGAGTTLVIVEQDIKRSLQVADRVYCLLEGKVSLQGLPADLNHEQISRAYFGL